MKHSVREQLRSQQVVQPVTRRPGQFVGMHYQANRQLVGARIASFQSEQEHSIVHTLLVRGLWTSVRAYQRGMTPPPPPMPLLRLGG